MSPLAFLQVNPVQTEALYSLVLDYAGLKGDESVWDLYCGIGTLTLALARQGGTVVGMEENPHAIRDARLNGERNGLGGVEFVEGRVEERISELSQRGTPDVVVLDPPRAGADRRVLEELLRIKPKKMVYVSCDPGTLARDLGLLVQGGYTVERVQPVDMFPWTEHTESVTRLERLKG